MPEESESEKPQISVDEDWKSQVEAERESAGEAQESAVPGQDESPRPPGPLPPPTLTFLASSFYLQGAMALGLLPTPGSEKPQVHLDQAKHSIDLIQMLYEKTQGNRTSEETKEFDTILHELRLSYVAVQQKEKDES